MRLFKARHHEHAGPPAHPHHDYVNVDVTADLWQDESGKVGRVQVEWFHSGQGCPESSDCPLCIAAKKHDSTVLVNDANREALLRQVVLAEAIAQEQLVALAEKFRAAAAAAPPDRCNALRDLEGPSAICKLPIGHDGSHDWEWPAARD